MVKEGVTRATALWAGEVDVANYVPREHVERLSRAPEMTVLRRRDSQPVASYCNLSKQPFDGAQVRRAILGYGIDRQGIVKTARPGLAQPLWSFVPPERGADGGGHPPGGHDLLRYLVKNMMFPSVATLPLLQAYWNQVKGYEPLHGLKVCFETTWIEKP